MRGKIRAQVKKLQNIFMEINFSREFIYTVRELHEEFKEKKIIEQREIPLNQEIKRNSQHFIISLIFYGSIPAKEEEIGFYN